MSRIPFDLLKKKTLTPTFSDDRTEDGVGRSEAGTAGKRRDGDEDAKIRERPSPTVSWRHPSGTKNTRCQVERQHNTRVADCDVDNWQANKPMSDAMLTAAEALIQPTVPHSGRSGPLPLAGLARNLANGPWLISRIERHLQERLCPGRVVTRAVRHRTARRSHCFAHSPVGLNQFHEAAIDCPLLLRSVCPVPGVCMRCIHDQLLCKS
jgi:hypothetical protein